MSKYKKKGDYHYQAFRDPKSIYRKHVLDLVKIVKKHVKRHGYILDVGSGEGLIMDQVRQQGFMCYGIDTDRRAVELAHQHDNAVIVGTIDLVKDEHYDAILMCDVLEHVEDLGETIDAAMAMTDTVIVAVPDRHDAHAMRQDIQATVTEQFIAHDWMVTYRDQRHGRHVMVFRREAEALQREAEEVVETETS